MIAEVEVLAIVVSLDDITVVVGAIVTVVMVEDAKVAAALVKAT